MDELSKVFKQAQEDWALLPDWAKPVYVPPHAEGKNMSEDFHGDPDNLLPFGPAYRRKTSPGIKFLIIRRGEPATEADPARLERAGWTGMHKDWFDNADEIAPGVYVKFLGYGDQFDKDKHAVRGALIAIYVPPT